MSPQEAVDFFREMLWAEATALGIGINLINVPGAITVGDGGIDAEVRDVPINGDYQAGFNQISDQDG